MKYTAYIKEKGLNVSLTEQKSPVPIKELDVKVGDKVEADGNQDGGDYTVTVTVKGQDGKAFLNFANKKEANKEGWDV